MTLTYGSLFSGIGGIDLGLDRAGMRCAWQVEIDEYATKVLAKHWPHVTRFRDVRDCGAHNLAPVDLIAGGFPCQDISSAGKRAGIAGERSGLWSEFARLLRELRPRYACIENVAALLYPLKRDGYIEPAPISRILSDLAACGYDAEWQVLPASAFGAPHIRERAFIVAYLPHATGDRCHGRQYQPQPGQCECTPFARENGNGQQVADSYLRQCEGGTQLQVRWQQIPGERNVWTDAGRCCEHVAHANRQGLAVRQVFGHHARTQLTAFERDGSTGAGQWAVEPGICRVADGIPHRVGRLRGLGNAVVPQVAEYIGRCILLHAQQEERAGV